MENRYYKIEDLPDGVMDLVKTECGDKIIFGKSGITLYNTKHFMKGSLEK